MLFPSWSGVGTEQETENLEVQRGPFLFGGKLPSFSFSVFFHHTDFTVFVQEVGRKISAFFLCFFTKNRNFRNFLENLNF